MENTARTNHTTLTRCKTNCSGCKALVGTIEQISIHHAALQHEVRQLRQQVDEQAAEIESTGLAAKRFVEVMDKLNQIAERTDTIGACGG